MNEFIEQLHSTETPEESSDDSGSYKPESDESSSSEEDEEDCDLEDESPEVLTMFSISH
ncbi:unnamed protein product [Porites evermanni]|uniref:Uncharacterized protein n=1 Tax=Porites evermanni TaxID=104178 RepID=A0ABN8MZV1_9CNID|nr:unnamed protein product [Porites evermanni]